jgi:hypothetical protein
LNFDVGWSSCVNISWSPRLGHFRAPHISTDFELENKRISIGHAEGILCEEQPSLQNTTWVAAVHLNPSTMRQ